MILMGGSDKVVGTTSTIKKDTNYMKYYTNAKDLGTKTVGDTVISEIIKLKPDVIFSYKSSDNTALKGTGIPVVEIGASKIVEVVDDITVLGKVMGMEKEADKILDWFKPLYKNFEKEKEKGEYVPGSYIRGSLREGNYARRATVATKAQRIIGIVGLILLAVVLIYFTKFYSLL